MEADSCKAKVHGTWTSITIDEALGAYADYLKRCPECHGRVRAHRRAKNGMRAHFEHHRAHAGCSLSRGVPFSGHHSIHPEAIS
jgi:hypothetical protein